MSHDGEEGRGGTYAMREGGHVRLRAVSGSSAAIIMVSNFRIRNHIFGIELLSPIASSLYL